jgi:SAM-dependent methyltransferase
MTRWDGDDYQKQFDDLAAAGVDVHGEAAFVMAYRPATVLDAGCGTGRVRIELARRGADVVGADVDPSMLATARAAALVHSALRGPGHPTIEWVESDLADLHLGRVFDVVVMAGNVPLFTPPGTQAALVAGCARHVAPGGLLVAGFSLDRRYSLADYDAHAAAAGLDLLERWATWDRRPFAPGGDYAVSVHRRPPT